MPNTVRRFLHGIFLVSVKMENHETEGFLRRAAGCFVINNSARLLGWVLMDLALEKAQSRKLESASPCNL